MELPNDLRWKIFNKLPLTTLQDMDNELDGTTKEIYDIVLSELKKRPGFYPKGIRTRFPDEYWRARAVELHGVSDLSSPYIGVYEKYLQQAALREEVGYGSNRHIPLQTCINLSIKNNNLNLLRYFCAIAEEEEDHSSEFSPIEYQNIPALEIMKEFDLPIDVYDRSYISTETYKWCYANIDQIDTRVTTYMVTRGVDVDPEEIRFNSIMMHLLFILATSMDIELYKRVVKSLPIESKFSYLPYMEDNVIKNIDIGMAIFFCCTNSLKKTTIEKIDIKCVKFGNIPNMPLERVTEMYEYLLSIRDNLETNSLENLNNYLELFHWRLFKRPGGYVKNYKSFHYENSLDYWIHKEGDMEMLKNWMLSGLVTETKQTLNLHRFPELVPILGKMEKSLYCEKNLIINFYSLELYNEMESKLGATKLKYCYNYKDLELKIQKLLDEKPELKNISLETDSDSYDCSEDLSEDEAVFPIGIPESDHEIRNILWKNLRDNPSLEIQKFIKAEGIFEKYFT